MNGLSWVTHEYVHKPKTSEWYWTVGIITAALVVTCIIFSNFLFAIVLTISVFALTLFSVRKPNNVNIALGEKGVRVDTILYPYSTLDSFGIDEEHHDGPLLFLKSKKAFMPLVSIHIKEHTPSEVREFMKKHLKEEHFEQSFFHSLIEALGF